MAYGDTDATRLKKLLSNPAGEAKHVWPFIKSRLIPVFRRLLEAFGVYSMSMPYSDHAALLRYVDRRDGFFVQCGGSDGHSNDPTYYLEKALGWKGVIAEPLPVAKKCQKNRPNSLVYNVAVGAPEDAGKAVEFVDVHGMSFVKGSIEDEGAWIDVGEKTQGITSKVVTVPVKTVQELVDGYASLHGRRDIDLFVADVEGYELNALKGLDFGKNRPRLLLLEIYGDDRLAAITAYVKERGYTLKEAFASHDYLFG